nr:MAG TPA: hypothetical protein [Caudoviricetes sp.]
MKKEKMVTRTFTRTHFEMMSVNTTTCDVTVTDEIMDAVFKSDADLLKHCQSIYNNEDTSIVKCTITSTEDILVGISESDFLRYGTILPPRPVSQQKKVGATDETE